jgi:hypothetical protein
MPFGGGPPEAAAPAPGRAVDTDPRALAKSGSSVSALLALLALLGPASLAAL